MPDYLGSGRRLYIDQLIDWETYFQLRDGHHADLEAEVGAYITILETTASLAESFQDAAREHWHEEARLTDDGGAESPPHILAAYAKLKEQGLVSLSVGEDQKIRRLDRRI